jgi:hypothetical protein
LASTGNVVIATGGLQTIDGVVTVAGDRVLLKDQTTAHENGIYQVNAGAWTRTGDMNVSSEFIGAFTFVQMGTVGADTGWLCSSNNPFTMGTTAVTWVQVSAAGQLTASNVGAGLGKVFKGKVGNNFEFKSILATNGIIVTDATTDVTIGVDSNWLTNTYMATRNFNQLSTGTTGNLVVTHNLNFQFVDVKIIDVTTSPMNTILTDVIYDTVNQLTVVLPGTRTEGQYRIIVQG